jgi:predicted dehydrogenase
MSELSRRDFLVGASAVSVAGVAGLQGSQEPIKPVGWAILGLGGYATRQIMPNIKNCKHTKLVALISGSPDKAERIAEQYQLPKTAIYNYQNLESIKDNPDIEVVYVITPPGTHHEFTMRSLRSGKHVCCEKPMTGDLKEAQEMVATAKQLNKRLQIGYRCHFEAHNLAAMKLCREGGLGTLRTVRSDHAFTMNWAGGWHANRKLGGYGAIGEIGVYAINALCYLAGAEPVEVMGYRHKLDVPRFKEVEDLNHFHFVFPNGVQGFGATAYSWNANNFRVYGNTGILNAEPATGYGGHQFTVNGQKLEVTANNQWADQMDHLSLCVRNPEMKLIAPGEMGLRDVQLIEAILESANKKESVPFKSPFA